MITKENGLKYAKLIHVSVDNGLTQQSNKVYIMEELADGRIQCQYGRVGKDLVTVYKQSREWDKIYKQKTSAKKGYKDVTDMVVESVTTDSSSKKKSGDVAEIKERKVKELFDDLMAFANKSIQKNYKVTQESVTQAQIDAAQEILDKAIKSVKKGMDVKTLNDLLIELYTIIPRKMKDVRDFLIKKADSKGDIDFVKEFLLNEQDTLDTMAGQVKLLKQQKDTTSDNTSDVDDDVEFTLLDQMGIIATEEKDPKAISLVQKLMGPNAHQMKRLIKCINTKTQATFDANLKKAKNKSRKLYWHGSRNENWFNIIQTGLMIRPSGAIHTGSMFGDGIYFANKAQKSIGYSSLRGSYWTGGGANKGYLALFDVHTGEQKHITHHDRSCYSLSKSVISKDGFDSVYAHGGADLRNDEFIVYDGAQCTIAYIVEIG
jgi:poly [ADP-ribose] polymerase